MNTSIKSPIQAKESLLTRGLINELARRIAQTAEMHATFLQKVEEFLVTVKSVREEIARVQSLPEGKKGDRGEQGVPGIGTPGRDGKDGVTPVVDKEEIARMAVRLIQKPKDGKDAEVPSLETIVQSVIDMLKEGDHLKIDERISGFRNEISSYRNQLAGKVYGKDTWARGGGDTVKAGANVTITTNNDGNKVISASGGGGTTFETPTGVVNGVNAVFTPSARPIYVVADGITYFEGAGYSWDGTNINMDVPPSQYIRDTI